MTMNGQNFDEIWILGRGNGLYTADLPPGLYFWAVEAGLPGGQRRERVRAGKAVRVP